MTERPDRPKKPGLWISLLRHNLDPNMHKTLRQPRRQERRRIIIVSRTPNYCQRYTACTYTQLATSEEQQRGRQCIIEVKAPEFEKNSNLVIKYTPFKLIQHETFIPIWGTGLFFHYTS
jgi:hypothetical protein